LRYTILIGLEVSDTRQLPFGRAYKEFPSKITYLISLLIFEEAFVAGRVVEAIGALLGAV